MQSKGESFKLEKTICCNKGGLVAMFLSHWDLPKSPLQVHGREESCSTQIGKNVVHYRKRIYILCNHGVYAPVIDTKA